MYWNHRVIEHDGEDGEKYFAIHEVYYGKDNKPMAYTENAVGITWGPDDNPMQILEWMTNCLSKPYLKKSDFPEAPPLEWGEPEDEEELISAEEFFKALEIKDPKTDEDEPR